MAAPNPGPTPSPTPIPVHAVRFGSIDVHEDGSATLTPDTLSGLSPFEVSKDYVQTCDPVAPGYYVVFANVTCFMSNAAFSIPYV